MEKGSFSSVVIALLKLLFSMLLNDDKRIGFVREGRCSWHVQLADGEPPSQKVLEGKTVVKLGIYFSVPSYQDLGSSTME